MIHSGLTLLKECIVIPLGSDCFSKRVTLLSLKLKREGRRSSVHLSET